jgi:SAM-dependent methyltransferase
LKKNKVNISKHYNKKYFDYQQNIGKFSGLANRIKFEELVLKNQAVLDFGCGGGYLLNSFKNIKKYGVEINKYARTIAINKNNLICFKSSSKLPSNFFDLIISDNALEHTENPLLELKQLYRSLKKNGKICLVVPLDNINFKYDENDINLHLYSFSPMNIGNLLKAANFDVIMTEPYIHKWIPYWYKLSQLLEKKFFLNLFHFFCRIWGKVDTSWYQVRAIGLKKA